MEESNSIQMSAIQGHSIYTFSLHLSKKKFCADLLLFKIAQAAVRSNQFIKDERIFLLQTHSAQYFIFGRKVGITGYINSPSVGKSAV